LFIESDNVGSFHEEMQEIDTDSDMVEECKGNEDELRST